MERDAKLLPQASGDPLEKFQRGVLDPPLQARDIGLPRAGLPGQRLLRHPRPPPRPRDPFSDLTLNLTHGVL